MTKYIDADRLKEAVEKKYNSNDTVGDRWDLGYDTACKQILDIIDSLQQEQPSLPSDLDEAANKFAVLYDQGTCDGIAQECFKAGAEWLAGQGVSMIITDETEWAEVDKFVHSNCDGTSIIQIRKID